MYRYTSMTLTQIGQCFGVSSHQVGRWLVDIGLRTEDKRPSQKAFDGKFCTQGPSRGEGYTWVWHSQRTVKALEDAGHKRVVPAPVELVEPPRLNGPLTYRARPDGIYEIVGGDGGVAVLCVGQDNAHVLIRILNLAHEKGVLDRLLAKKTEV